ncbi:MAG: alkyl sulfatase dimerization domain-containing protein, partial [Myxococcales bacterium]|nr:alkyl sulfatase dimerization domain-containing protein [Myxococcales bacterium]
LPNLEDMGDVRRLSERLLAGETTTETEHPFNPKLLLEELGPRSAFFSGFANVGVLDTDEGLVLVDTGSWLLAQASYEKIRAWSTREVKIAIFTHGHIDHVMGLGPFEDEAEREGRPRIEVVANEAMPARFERYRRMQGYNSCINSRQFGIPIEWPSSYREPDRLFRGTTFLEVGGLMIELHTARGETDDHAWAYLPERRILFTGDLFIWASPNAGNPQKVQRYPLEWAQALREMEALGAEVLSPGHGPPIWGKEAVRRALSETADLLEFLVRETLDRMNAGMTLDQILHEVKAPGHLLARPYLRPVYDEPSFLVRNIWRLYGGWYDGNPSRLLPAPDAAVARELASLAGGASRLANRAMELLPQDSALAAHLVEQAWLASPEDTRIKEARRAVYRQRVAEATSLMAKGIFRAVAEE